MVQVDVGRGLTAAGVPEALTGTAAALPCVQSRAHARCAGSFTAATKNVAATLVFVWRHDRAVGDFLHECRWSAPGARIGSRPRDLDTTGTRRLERSNRAAASDGQRS